MTNTDEAGGSHSQLGRAHAYLDFLADQERQQAGCPDRLVMTDDDGGGAGADTDATNDIGTETGADDVPNYSTEGGTSQASEERRKRGHDAQMSSAPEEWWSQRCTLASSSQ